MSEDVLSIDSAIISDPQNRKVFEIQNSVSDIEIFEHIDKPYLTGQVSFLDTAGVFDEMQFKGVEKFTLSLRFPESEDEPVKKTFIIDKIIGATKKNDKSELIVFHIIEEHGFVSTFLNVNKAYEGSGRDIIAKIVRDTLNDYELSDVDANEMKDNIQLIVPNMTPLEACNWVKDRTTSISGTPYYFFSTLANLNKLHFISLATLMEGQRGANSKEYFFSRSLSGTTDRLVHPYIIQDYRSTATADISSLIDKSLLGAEYNVIDTMTSEQRNIQFDAINRFRLTPELKALAGSDFIFNNTYKYRQKSLNDIPSRKTSTIMSGQSYSNHRSFRETSSPSNAIWSKALRSILVANPIDVVVSGQTFFNSRINKTIGNLIKIRFLNNNFNQDTNDVSENTDKVKSGRHLIYAARHIIRKEKYDVVLSCVKLENLK